MEHKAVRSAVGVFDISHMGQFIASGHGAEAFLNRALTQLTPANSRRARAVHADAERSGRRDR